MEHMTSNFHSHTWRCGHAVGTEREYVDTAIKAGFTVWGFSDHIPLPGYSPERSAGMRMTMDQLQGYVDTVKDLGDEYGEKIELHAGLEAEYVPALFGELSRSAVRAGVEYLILGQHFTTGGAYSGAAADSPERLRDYCRLVKEGMETGLFSLVAHPDLINFTGDAALFYDEARGLCLRAKELGIPLELNLLGLAMGKHYPNPAFWCAAAETGNRVVFSLDAHAPEHIAIPRVIERGFGIARDMGLDITGSIDLKRLK